ncbi:site-specific integrase [Hydrogenophaga sp.]|mgnify:CR=1 FL=1|uniref:site-specific integrase n=1 Tax=Hydrogenophaga sp. TaxID=1904254 RepID=UPI001ACC6669|nr:site-specific integrase [Hydrogenophaga sp.]MBN9373629.1 site-specific integrase [Hydrogenophaga sp.]
MATIQNRSRITVTVKNRPDVTRFFPYNALGKVEAYVKELRSQGLRPAAKQGDDTWEVRVRDKGYPSQNITCHSRKEAETLVKKLDAERSTGLVRDYTKAHQVTFAHLLLRYLREFKGKSARVIAYKVESWLEDSGEAGKGLLASYRAEQAAAGTKVRKASFQMRDTIRNLEWIHKPLSLVKADDINGYIVMRLNKVSEATVDREVDLFSAVMRKATRSWGYHLADYPMHGVERPKYFNERDRRFKVGEEEKLFAAIRKLDHEHAVKATVEGMLAAEYPNAKFSSLSAQKKEFAVRREALRPHAEQVAIATPRLETFFQFLLMTGARRGEALSLKWSDVDFEAKTAYLAMTKNGRPRKLSLRSDLIELMETLPRVSDQVFDMGYSWLADMWHAACKEAGIDDFRIHDLRHEAISRVAETGVFGLVDLQAFSGHRDVRMLLRYSHLCATRMAHKLDEAFKHKDKAIRQHKGRELLKKDAGVTMREIIEDAPGAAAPENVTALAAGGARDSTGVRPCAAPRNNVIQFPMHRVA